MKNKIQLVQGSKWIKGLNGKLDIHEAARLVLSHRFYPVSYWLNRVLESSHPSDEDVHQLRISARRASAALRIFKCCLLKKRLRNLKKALRTIQKTAGPIRDLDVFRNNIEAWLPTSNSSSSNSIDCLRALAYGQRIVFLREIFQLHDFAIKFPEVINKALKSLKMPEKPTIKNLNLQCDKSLSVSYINLTQNLKGNLNNQSNLHKLRLSGKRLRYSIEIFADITHPEMTTRLYPELEHLQELLGSVNDAYFSINFLRESMNQIQTSEELWERIRPGFDLLQEINQQKLSSSINELTAWVDKWKEMGSTLLELFPNSKY